MKLQTKAAAIASATVFTAFAICQIEPVTTIIAAVVAGFIGWSIGCKLAPDEPVQGDGFTRRPDGTYEFKDNSHRNYEDF